MKVKIELLTDDGQLIDSIVGPGFKDLEYILPLGCELREGDMGMSGFTFKPTIFDAGARERRFQESTQEFNKTNA